MENMENSSINCRVVELEPTAEYTTDAFGITDERAEELFRLVMHGLIDKNSISAMLAKLSLSCNHPNELAFVCLTAGKMLEQRKNARGNFAEFLGKLGG